MKPGATTLPWASMVLAARAMAQIADGGYVAGADAHVAGVPRGAGAVDDVAVDDDDVKKAGSLRERRRDCCAGRVAAAASVRRRAAMRMGPRVSGGVGES